MQSSSKLLKNQVPKSVQIDDVFEFDPHHLEDVKSVNLIFWRSREAFDAHNKQATSSLYDGYGVNPATANFKQSNASMTSEAVA